MPNKDNAPPSSSPNQQQSSSSMLNYYHHPYYHLAFNDSDNIPDEQRLMAQLLRNYDPSARPVYNASNTVSVAFGIALTQLSDMVCHQINRPFIWNERKSFQILWKSFFEFDWDAMENLSKRRVSFGDWHVRDRALFCSKEEEEEEIYSSENSSKK